LSAGIIVLAGTSSSIITVSGFSTAGASLNTASFLLSTSFFLNPSVTTQTI
jgi:hypothetical protein